MKYLNKLSNQKIVQFLNENGFSLLTNNTDKQGNLINPLSRSENAVLVRAKLNKYEEQTKLNTSSPFVKHLLYTLCLTYAFNLDNNLHNAHVLILKDYSIQSLSSDEVTEFDIKLHSAYIQFLYKEFGDEYAKDYNNYVTNLQSNSQKEL